MMKEKKGFTMVGLIVGATIASFIMLFCLTWIVNDIKTFKSGEETVLAQDSAQDSVNYLSEMVMQAGKFNKVVATDGTNYIDQTVPVSISYAELDDAKVKLSLNAAGEFLGTHEATHIFKVKNIDECILSPLPDGATFREARGVKINVKAVVKEKTSAADTYIYFRN